MKVITLAYDKNWEALEWAKNHCPSYITNDVKPIIPDDEQEVDEFRYVIRYRAHLINYYFNEDEDAVLFALRWS